MISSLRNAFRLPRAAEGAGAGPLPVTKTDAEWRAALTPGQYRVLREHATEPPGSSSFEHDPRVGTYFCAACNNPLYRSDTKFDSGCGWPSFFEALPGAIATSVDNSHGMRRIEVHCARCGGHLGHVFNDGPRPTGQRFCMNGVAMTFTPDKA
jgi:peptide-methionine (R)-S-oxide reductase